jgi:hypothetical protein
MLKGTNNELYFQVNGHVYLQYYLFVDGIYQCGEVIRGKTMY